MRRSPLAPRTLPQFTLPWPQVPWKWPETRAQYAAVVRLRRRGLTIRKAGRHHIVDGVRMTSRQLFTLDRRFRNGSAE